MFSSGFVINSDLPFIHLCFLHTAPSQIRKFIKEAVQQRSIQLSWQEPRQANGVVKEYEIKYYEKVSWSFCTRHSSSVTLSLDCNNRWNDDEIWIGCHFRVFGWFVFLKVETTPTPTTTLRVCLHNQIFNPLKYVKSTKNAKTELLQLLFSPPLESKVAKKDHLELLQLY